MGDLLESIAVITAVPLVIAEIETFKIRTILIEMLIAAIFYAPFLLDTEQQQPMTVSHYRFT